MDLKRTRVRLTREQKLAIIEEYETGTLTGAELARKYGYRSPSIIFNWRERLLNPRPRLQVPKKNSIFASEIAPQMTDDELMKKLTPEELEAEVKRLTKELEWAQLQNKALNTLIDIAEAQGIRIRKKSGAKQ